jgi:hypothetical protein
MFRALKSLFAHRPTATRGPAAPARRRTRLDVERLEDRLVPTVLFYPQNGVENATNPGGPVLGNVSWGMPVYTIYWGTYWFGTTGQTLANAVQGTIKPMLYQSPYLDGLHQYGVNGRAGVNASGPIELFINADPSPSGISQTALYNTVVNGFQKQGLPGPGAYPNEALYLVVTAPGTILLNSGGTNSGLTGYHTNGSVSGQSFAYGWIQSGGAVDTTTPILSHEVVETMTDPGGGSWQVDPRSSGAWNEIGDNEAQNYNYRVNGYLVQSYWSQSNGQYAIDDGNQEDFDVNNGQLILYGDQLANHNDTFSINTSAQGGVTVTMNGETATFDPGQISLIDVYPESGSNTINVLNTTVPVYVVSGTGATDTVNIGNGTGGVRGILGDVHVNANDSGGTAAVTIDDSADAGGRTATVSQFQVTGLAPATISYSRLTTSSLTIDGGSGNSQYTVASAAVPTTLNTGSGKDTVLVGSAGTLDGIAAALTVTGQGGADTMTVNDQNSTAAQTYETFSLFSSGLGFRPNLSITYAGIGTIDLSGSKVGGTYRIDDLPGGVNYDVTGSGGNNVYEVGHGVENCSAVVGQVVFNSSHGNDALTIDDQKGAGGQTYTVNSSVITMRPDSPGIGYGGMASVTVNGSTAGATYNTDSTAAGTRYLLIDAGDNVFNLCPDSQNCDNLAGPLTLDGGGGSTSLTIDDQASTGAWTYYINAGAFFLRPSAATIQFSGMAAVVLNGSRGGDTYEVGSTAAGTVTTLSGGAGKDTFNVSPVEHTSGNVAGLLNIQGDGTGTLTVNDEANTDASAAETAVLAGSSGTFERAGAGGSQAVFLQYTGIANPSADMGPDDFGLLYDMPGQNTFVSAGMYSYETGNGYFAYISGTKYVYAYAVNGTGDVAYHYDGSGPSALVASGTAYTFMLGTDQGHSFFNEAVGFKTTYAIAQHAGQDTAFFYDSPGNDVLVGATASTCMYADDAQGSFAEFDYAQGFAQVYAYSFVGGTDYAYNHDPSHNTVVGFTLL